MYIERRSIFVAGSLSTTPKLTPDHAMNLETDRDNESEAMKHHTLSSEDASQLCDNTSKYFPLNAKVCETPRFLYLSFLSRFLLNLHLIY